MASVLVGALCATSFHSSQAQDAVATVPEGYITISVPAGATRSISIPLNIAPAGNGEVVGRLTGAGPDYLENSGAGWTPGAFSQSSKPHYVRIKSGVHEGKIFLISTSTPNTSTRLYINNEGVDLVSSGFAFGEDGDTYEICEADTLSSFFGDDVLQGGSSASSADNVQVWVGSSFLTFYYNTSWNRWARNSDSIDSPSRDSFVLRPDRGLFVIRRAGSSVNITVFGRVPDSQLQFKQNRPGVTFVNVGLPVDTTLADLALHLASNNPGWVGWNDYTTAGSYADLIEIWSGVSWLRFFYHTSNGRWQRVGEASQVDRGGFTIPAGRPLMITRRSAGGNGFATVALPYSLEP